MGVLVPWTSHCGRGTGSADKYNIYKSKGSVMMDETLYEKKEVLLKKMFIDYG